MNPDSHSWTVYYERPENTLNPISGLTQEQAIKLLESFSAQRIACCMDADPPEEGPIEIRLPLVPEKGYRAIMQRTSQELIDEAMKASNGNQSRAAEYLGLNRSTFTCILRSTNRRKKLRRVA